MTTSPTAPKIYQYPCHCGNWSWSVLVKNEGICPKCGRKYRTELKNGIVNVEFENKANEQQTV